MAKYVLKCQMCDAEFTSGRIHTKTCSPKCRKSLSRRDDEREETVTGQRRSTRAAKRDVSRPSGVQAASRHDAKVGQWYFDDHHRPWVMVEKFIEKPEPVTR